MTVDPGFAGQPFVPQMLDKVAELKAWRGEKVWSTKLGGQFSCNQAAKKLMARADALYRRHWPVNHRKISTKRQEIMTRVWLQKRYSLNAKTA